MAKGPSNWNLNAAVRGTSKTEISNNSGENIFLIPISCLDGQDPRKSGQVVYDDKLAQVIPPGHSIKVNSRQYDYNPKDPSSQIHILFRVGGHNDVNKFLQELPKKKGCVQVEKKEKLFLHFMLLDYGHLSLKYEGGLVIGEVKNAPQADAAKTQKNQSELENLIKQMKKLGEKVKVLEAENKTLKDENKTLKDANKTLNDANKTLNTALSKQNKK